MRLFLIISLVFALAVDIGVALVVEKYETNSYTNYPREDQYQRKTLEGPFILGAKSMGLWLLEFVGRNDKAISAFSTFVIAIFTIVLAIATGTLVRLARQQESTSKMHERAHIYCGGLFGVPKTPNPTLQAMYRPKATDFEPPWRIVIHNWGRTPGCITKIEYGECPQNEFPVEISVSRIIEKRMLPIELVDIQEVFAPTGHPVPYRHVERSVRVVGNVFFGKISYKDVFGDQHHSTFALLHREEYTDSIGKSFADDIS